MIGLLIRCSIAFAVVMAPIFVLVVAADTVVTPVVKFVMRDSNRPGCIKEFKSYDPENRGNSFTFNFSEWDYKRTKKPWLTPDGYNCDRTVDLPRYADGQPVDSLALRDRIKQLNKVCENLDQQMAQIAQRMHKAYQPNSQKLVCRKDLAIKTCKENEALSLEASRRLAKRYVSQESTCLAVFESNQS